MKLSSSAFETLVRRKRDGGELERDEIEALIRAYSAGHIDDEHFATWLRAVMDHGLSDDETAWLTSAMASSGTVLSWDDVAGTIIDKHSTGGVGDAVSLIAVPIAAACGVRVAKLSGRALGHTGGTLDKLETIPHVRTHLSVAEFKHQVTTVGCAIAAATDDMAPADKKIYALRHRTHTVRHVGLITASVLSKKIAAGASHFVIDVKCGHCAFMQTQDEATALARSIAHVAPRLGRTVTVLVTDMDQPLAPAIGDALELEDALAILRGKDGGRLREISLTVAEAMLALPHRDDRRSAQTRMRQVEQVLESGAALDRFARMVAAQGGDIETFRAPQPVAIVAAQREGYVSAIDGRVLAEAVAVAKSHDHDAASNIGLRLLVQSGERVRKGDPVAQIYGARVAQGLTQAIGAAVTIGDSLPKKRFPAVIDREHAEGRR